MAEKSKKKQLVEFLEEKAFEPVIKTRGTNYKGDPEKKMLEHVKRSTRAEEKRYREQYRTASEVKQRFFDDLTSRPAKKVDEELKQLGLPRLPDMKDEFLHLCDRIGVK